MLDILILPEEGQTNDSVAFTWEPVSFSGSALELQIKFEKTEQISMYSDKNSIEV